MQSLLSRIWTRVAVSISYDDNDYTTGTSIIYVVIYVLLSSCHIAGSILTTVKSYKEYLL